MRALVLSFAALAALSSAAGAQVLPETSRSESQVNQINRSIQAQQRNVQSSQQNQFETNQIRGEIQRQNSLPVPPPVGCGPSGRC